MATSPAQDIKPHARPQPGPGPHPIPAPRPHTDTAKLVAKLNEAFPNDPEMQKFIAALKQLLGH